METPGGFAASLSPYRPVLIVGGSDTKTKEAPEADEESPFGSLGVANGSSKRCSTSMVIDGVRHNGRRSEELGGLCQYGSCHLHGVSRGDANGVLGQICFVHSDDVLEPFLVVVLAAVIVAGAHLRRGNFAPARVRLVAVVVVAVGVEPSSTHVLEDIAPIEREVVRGHDRTPFFRPSGSLKCPIS